jgi:hypothetical protein
MRERERSPFNEATKSVLRWYDAIPMYYNVSNMHQVCTSSESDVTSVTLTYHKQVEVEQHAIHRVFQEAIQESFVVILEARSDTGHQ